MSLSRQARRGSEQMAEIGALALCTDTELLPKSRLAIPGRLKEAEFDFAFPD